MTDQRDRIFKRTIEINEELKEEIAQIKAEVKELKELMYSEAKP